MELLLSDWERSGVMPPALKNQPEIPSHLLPYLDSYNALRCHRTRSESGYNPIDYPSVVLYAQTHGFFDTQDNFNRFEILVQACDHAFLEFADEKQRQAIAAMKAKARSKS